MHLSNVSNLVYQDDPTLNNKLNYKATNVTHQNPSTFFQKHKENEKPPLPVESHDHIVT
jgi:hypothetical protein